MSATRDKIDGIVVDYAREDVHVIYCAGNVHEHIECYAGWRFTWDTCGDFFVVNVASKPCRRWTVVDPYTGLVCISGYERTRAAAVKELIDAPGRLERIWRMREDVSYPYYGRYQLLNEEYLRKVKELGES